MRDSRPDLSDRLTVFLTTVGNPTFDECRDRLREQDCRFRLKIIRNVAPLSAAFQRMLDECTTPLYVQVDEDMLLYNHAIRTLYERMRSCEERVAFLACALYDVHLQRCIMGIKIFRHTITRHFPFRNVEGCEWDQVRRLREAGFLYDRLDPAKETRDSPGTLGLHGTRWTAETVYERFGTLERKRRRGNRTHDWLLESGPQLLRRFMETGSEIDLFAVMGVISGTIAGDSTIGGEKDYRRYDRLSGMNHLRQFLDEVRGRSSPTGDS